MVMMISLMMLMMILLMMMMMMMMMMIHLQPNPDWSAWQTGTLRPPTGIYITTMIITSGDSPL